MESPFIHIYGSVGSGRDRSVTVSIRRGTSSADTLFLLTKIMEIIARDGVEHCEMQAFNEVRVAAAPPAALRSA